MRNLTELEIEAITHRINSSNIKSNEMREDLIDHFCCSVEEDMKRGVDFEQAYQKAYQSVCPDGFDEIQRETIFLLTYKKIKTIKMVMYLSAYLCVASLILTFYLDLTHTAGASITLLTGSVAFLFLFLPAFFINLYKRQLSRSLSNKLMFVFGFIGVAVFMLSVVFKMFHWPGAKMLFLTSIAVVNLAYFPMLFFKMYKKSLS
ncbi:hypothetical protein J1N10_07890 [Carboxylicivirga sp. A043]|uniref:hypothetical protein n=1 Tax=Carboxylicivirga litoralis TaxID=2816963 RepID=UPI0021CAFA43|nr:hypothetical protein [Carboxylicivirga sp. A043]MCU4155893.1 hypothetical protein [Carboxylicivirga sp. A043]